MSTTLDILTAANDVAMHASAITANTQAIADACTSVQAQLDALQHQVDNPPLTFPALQSMGQGAPYIGWELLWGVGRSHPVSNPPVHGTASLTPGAPATLAFAPAKLAGGESDNLYMLRRLGKYIPPALLAAASRFTLSLRETISDISAPQALEIDYQLQRGTKLWNMGLQLKPSAPFWILRSYDYVARAWQSTGITVDQNKLKPGGGFSMLGEWHVDDTSVTLDAVTLADGQRHVVNMQHPVATAASPADAYNLAIQLDATADAKPYTAIIQDITVSLGV